MVAAGCLPWQGSSLTFNAEVTPMKALLLLLVLPFTQLDPNAYQSFIVNWAPAASPFCAAIDSASQWNAVFHPAPVMGANRTFAPPASFWADHAVLLVARVVPAGRTSAIFRLTSVVRSGGTTTVAYAFRPPSRASSTMKWWMGVAVGRPLSPIVRFQENGRTICTLARGEWESTR